MLKYFLIFDSNRTLIQLDLQFPEKYLLQCQRNLISESKIIVLVTLLLFVISIEKLVGQKTQRL